MDDSSVVGVLAEALAQHQLNNWWEVSKPDGKRVSCSCKWVHESDGLFGWESGRDAHAIHREHVASVVAALPNIAIVELPKPDTNDRIQHWKVGDISVSEGTGLVWADLEPTVHSHVTARVVAANLLAAARAARGQA